jgi:hypothetical protein
MKTLADFKRALTVGSTWSCYNSLYNMSFGIRKVACVKSNKVGFETEEGGISWLYFPVATEFEINKLTGAAEIYHPECDEKPKRLILTYSKV